MKVLRWRGSRNPKVLVQAEILHELIALRLAIEDVADRLIVALSRVS